MKRVFLAAPLVPVEEIIGKTEQLQKQLPDYQIRWVKTENFHLTLFFFGEIPLLQIPVISLFLRSYLRNSATFAISLKGPGIFKKGKEPRVLWLDVEASDSLDEIKSVIDRAAADLGYIPDEKDFRPHMTLGRFIPRQEVSPSLVTILNDVKLKKPIEFYVSKLILFESKLFPAGPQYRPIEVFPLRNE
jgi:RNA 2',3'-cyclic 3'-phosphodiesterase